MKVALFAGAVALVAAQPFPFSPVPAPQQQGVCQVAKGYNSHCCLSPVRFPFGCEVVPGTPPPRPMWGRPPPPPPYAFLSQVCCGEGEQCCMVDTANAFQPSFTCCDRKTQKCNVTTGKGVCEENFDSSETFPFSNKLDNFGRCPEDGGLPLMVNPSQPFLCTLDPAAQGLSDVGLCPSGAYCSKDNTANDFSGVCCFDTQCGLRQSCTNCTTPVPAGELTPQNANCAWLAQGDVLDSFPRCVRSCSDYPDASCIITHVGGTQCPRSPWNENGVNYNTGNCRRRCGNVGTGRSSRINIMGNFPMIFKLDVVDGDDIYEIDTEKFVAIFDNATDCCREITGDFCCSTYLQLADHCSLGRVPGGPMCGVPISGTPNTFFNTAPFMTPPSVDAYVATHLPRPPMMFPPMMPPPMAYGGGFPGFGGPMPMNGFGMYGGMGGGMMSPFMAPFMYRNYGATEEELVKAGIAEESDKQFFFPGASFSPYRPMAPRPVSPPPPASDQQPSAFICSCDTMCMDEVNADCCDDYWELCDIVVNNTQPPDWWVYLERYDDDSEER